MLGSEEKEAGRAESSGRATNETALFEEAKRESDQTARGSIVDHDGQLMIAMGPSKEGGVLYEPATEENARRYLAELRARMSESGATASQIGSAVEKELPRLGAAVHPERSVFTAEQADAALEALVEQATHRVQRGGLRQSFGYLEERICLMGARAAELRAKENPDDDLNPGRLLNARDSREEAAMWRKFADGENISRIKLFNSETPAEMHVATRIQAYRDRAQQEVQDAKDREIAESRERMSRIKRQIPGQAGRAEVEAGKIEVPEDNKVMEFVDQNFTRFSPDKIPHMRAYAEHQIRIHESHHPGGNVRYPDTVSGIIGNAEITGLFLANLINYANAQRGKTERVTLDQVRGMKFSDVARDYLGLNVEDEHPDYFKIFG